MFYVSSKNTGPKCHIIMNNHIPRTSCSFGKAVVMTANALINAYAALCHQA